MPEPVDPHHLLLIGSGPGVGAAVVRRFGRDGFRSTLISRSASLDQLAPELRSGGLEIEAIGADIEDLDGYRETLERIFSAPGAPGVVVYNAALPDLLPNESQVAESGAQRGEVSAQLIEAQVAAGSVEDVVLREVGAECGVVLAGDRLIADADQITG